jgi:Txe/YoeB family toxin of toxin-antitoxin system
MIYKILLTPRAIKDAKKLKNISLKEKAGELINIIRNNPFQNPPPYKKLKGYNNRYSRRINKQHRLVYTMYEDTIKINSM